METCFPVVRLKISTLNRHFHSGGVCRHSVGRTNCNPLYSQQLCSPQRISCVVYALIDNIMVKYITCNLNRFVRRRFRAKAITANFGSYPPPYQTIMFPLGCHLSNLCHCQRAWVHGIRYTSFRLPRSRTP